MTALQEVRESSRKRGVLLRRGVWEQRWESISCGLWCGAECADGYFFPRVLSDEGLLRFQAGGRRPGFQRQPSPGLAARLWVSPFPSLGLSFAAVR